MSLFGSPIPQFETEYNGTAGKKLFCSYKIVMYGENQIKKKLSFQCVK
jgi:hypothetical protein